MGECVTVLLPSGAYSWNDDGLLDSLKPPPTSTAEVPL